MKEKRTTVNIRWVKFANNLLEGMNHTDAYTAAGYTKDRKSAATNAWDLLRNPDFHEMVPVHPPFFLGMKDKAHGRLLFF